ncbi:MAG TPA: hypothetical protein VEL03_09955, partial [Streptosporangiaceae bacterium]|nr:hypothetical protein [Streptosporangiaceae bacterium]
MTAGLDAPGTGSTAVSDGLPALPAPCGAEDAVDGVAAAEVDDVLDADVLGDAGGVVVGVGDVGDVGTGDDGDGDSVLIFVGEG